ncbi:MAG: hypothetical protein WBV73_26125, partial [Phormidium sp.]
MFTLFFTMGCFSSNSENNLISALNNSGTNAAVLTINTGTTQHLHKQVYGFNTNQMNAEYTYTDPEFIELTSKLKPTILRFPGGTIANFYHWKISGFIEDELSSTNSENLNRRNLRNYNRLRSRRNGKISFDEFMALCQKLKIKPVIVVNLYTGTPSESADWVSYVKDKGYEVAGWELGNEFYWRTYRNKFPTVRDYIEVAKEHAAAMKAVDPNIKLAVVASSVGFRQDIGKGQAQFEEVWNRQIARENFYDGYTIHLYTYSLNDDRPVPENEAREFLFGSSDITFSNAINYYENLFGNREIWITEWNIANPKLNMV